MTYVVNQACIKFKYMDEAILPDTEPGMEEYLELNKKYSEIWPNITMKKDSPVDADEFKDKKNKLQEYFSEKPGTGD